MNTNQRYQGAMYTKSSLLRDANILYENHSRRELVPEGVHEVQHVHGYFVNDRPVDEGVSTAARH
jgi:hypothetical protein